jgi:adenylate kinase
MNLILLGPPGAGKGTQAEVLRQKLNIPSISTGMLLRNAIEQGTQLGKEAEGYIAKGNLVPDTLVVDLLKERISQSDTKNGFILDGFPRNRAQAELLDTICSIDKVLSLEVSDADIIKRLSGRRVCNSCGASYHTVYKPSKKEMVCDNCGAALSIREDDKEETVLNRLNVYHSQTEPIKEYYQLRGKLYLAYGQEEVADTTKEVLRVLGLE